MTRFQIALDAFISCGSLANAKKLVKLFRLNPELFDSQMTEDHAGIVRNAERIVDDAKDPTKIREAMQRELRARFKNLNITVI